MSEAAAAAAPEEHARSSTPVLADPKGHLLKPVDAQSTVTCKNCKKSVAEAEGGMFACATCKGAALCGKCAAVLMEQNVRCGKADAHPMQGFLHDDLCKAHPEYLEGYACDECCEFGPFDAIFHCGECEYDLCPMCAGKLLVCDQCNERAVVEAQHATMNSSRGNETARQRCLEAPSKRCSRCSRQSSSSSAQRPAASQLMALQHQQRRHQAARRRAQQRRQRARKRRARRKGAGDVLETAPDHRDEQQQSQAHAHTASHTTSQPTSRPINTANGRQKHLFIV